MTWRQVRRVAEFASKVAEAAAQVDTEQRTPATSNAAFLASLTAAAAWRLVHDCDLILDDLEREACARWLKVRAKRQRRLEQQSHVPERKPLPPSGPPPSHLLRQREASASTPCHDGASTPAEPIAPAKPIVPQQSLLYEQQQDKQQHEQQDEQQRQGEQQQQYEQQQDERQHEQQHEQQCEQQQDDQPQPPPQDERAHEQPPVLQLQPLKHVGFLSPPSAV